MNTLAVDAFLKWAEGAGLGLDERYPGSAVLIFQGGSEARFWNVPPTPQRRPYFIASLIRLMGDWQTCHVWRHLGSWPAPSSVRQERINDVVELRILQGLGLPLGTTDIVEFQRAEFDSLVTLLLSTTVFGSSVGQDLYVVPDHARQILKTDHHDAIHVSFRDAAEVQSWISRMAELGFRLPDELPDSTFKRPPWMRGGQREPNRK
jgi:hypothetical protein